MCCQQSTGLPKGREPYGDGASIVVSGRESRLHGHRGVKGAQGRSEAGFPWTGRQGTRDANRQNDPEHNPRLRQTATVNETRKPESRMMRQVSRPGVCPAKAGVFSRRETYQGKSQSPVARRAGGRETNLLKPLDSLICGMGASLQAVAQANAEVAPKVSRPGGRACNRKGEGSMGRRRLADAADHSGGVGATAWGQGHAEQLEKPSASHCESGGAR